MMVSSFVASAGGWMGAIGAWAVANPIMAGALVGGIYSGAQTAINGGSISDVLKSAAIGAVTGAVGAVVGAGMHGLGDAVGSMLQGGDSLLGTVVHLAAHGAAGGGMSAAMGGNFQDGFIGGVIGAGVTGAFGKAFSGVSKDIGVLGRTAVAAVSGGVASVLSGGKFADGAYSAAFFHLFNSEGEQVLEVAGEMAHTVYQGLARFGDALNPFGDPALNAGVYDETLGGGVYSDIASVTNPIAIGGKLGLGRKISQGWNKLKAFAWTSKAAKTTAGAADDAAKWIWGQNKGVAKSIRQMNQRGWTPSQVTEALKIGQQFPVTNLVNKANPAIRYVHPITGQSVVQDTVTKEIIHFGGPGFKY